jgi:hypothetical protein
MFQHDCRLLLAFKLSNPSGEAHNFNPRVVLQSCAPSILGRGPLLWRQLANPLPDQLDGGEQQHGGQ